MTTLRDAAQAALEALESYRNMMFVEAGCRFKEGEAAIAALRDALAQEGQEPAVLHRELVEIHSDGTETWKETPPYTHPPRREWQGLTDTDIARVFRNIYGGVRWGPSEKEFAIAIEAALKEKNNG